jgi:general secretion pathway protein D
MVDDTVILLTTDNLSDMEKASAILKVIDSKQKYRVVPAAIKPDASSLPNTKEIDASFEGLAIGTFKHLPKVSKVPMAIVDMHKSNLIIIAPENRINKIRASVRRNCEQKRSAKGSLVGQGSKVLPKDNTSETKLDRAIKELLIASETATAIETRHELETFSKSLGQSTGPKSQPDEREMEVTITVGDKQKTTRIKGDKVVEQVESIVEKTETTKEAPGKEEPNQESPDTEVPEFEPLDKELFAELMKVIEAENKQQSPNDVSEKEVEKEKVEATEEKQEPKAVEEKKEPKVVEKEQEPKAVEEKKPAEKQDYEHESLQPIRPNIVTISQNDIMRFIEKEPTPIEDIVYDVNIPGTEAEANTVLTIPTEVEITELMDMLGKLLGINYMYDPVKIKGKIILKIHDGKIKVKDLYALVENALRFRKFATIRHGNLITIVPEIEATNNDPELVEDMDDIKPGDIVVGTIFKLNHISTDNAMTFLRNMKLGTLPGGLQPIAETGTLIVIEYARRMPRVAKLLKMIDVKGEPRKFAFREMKYTSAEVMATKVQTLADQLGTIQISIAAAAKTSTSKTTSGRRPPSRPTPRPSPTRPSTKTPAKGQGSVYLDIDERTNRILMIGLVKDLQIINELIDSLDLPKRDPRRIERYKIEHVDADEVMSALSSLGIISYSSSSRSGSSRYQSRTQPRTGTSGRPTTPSRTGTTGTTASGAPILPGEEPQIVTLASTNSLLVNATDEQHEQVVMIIGHVDRELEDAANPYVIYRLENQKPEDLAEVLDKIVNATLSGSSKGRTGSKDPKISTGSSTRSSGPMASQEDVITIVPDENTFSLIVYASRKNQEQIARMITELDKRRPQVLIDVTLVEIYKNDDFQYDLDLVTALPTLASTSGAITGVGAFDTIDEIVTKLGNADGRSSFQDFGFHRGTADVFYADNHIQALLKLMKKRKYGRVMAQPKILVNDNEPATINQQKTIYIARTTSISNASTGTDNTFLNTSTSFDSFPSGIDLAITPHISEGDLLRLEIELNRSQQASPTDTDENTPPPDLTENNIKTVVTVPDNCTIILGGISEIAQEKDSGKIPILGDLPIIGPLFQNTTNFDKQAKLYIFVKAYILRPDDTKTGLPALVERSDEYRAAFEKEEAKFHKHSWGTFKKENPMPPMKILEEK